jgi:hypothetical protein
MQPWALKRHIPIEGSEYERIVTLTPTARPADIASPMRFDPGSHLRLDERQLDGSELGFSFGKGKADLLRALRLLLESSNLLDFAGRSVLGRDLKQYPDMHDDLR